jgi:AcrR family transcriptional regulator
MTRVANSEPRPYRSVLREEQADATRRRILDAAVRVLARGIATISVPAVAREAGVSVPTVYRHFGSKQALLSALYPYLVERTGASASADPRSLDELLEGVRRLFGRLDAFDDLARAAAASPAGDEARRATMPDRLARIGRIVDTIQPPLPPAGRDRVARLLAVLTASASLRMWRDHLGVSVDEAAEDVDWAIRAAVAAARGEP